MIDQFKRLWLQKVPEGPGGGTVVTQLEPHGKGPGGVPWDFTERTRYMCMPMIRTGWLGVDRGVKTLRAAYLSLSYGRHKLYKKEVYEELQKYKGFVCLVQKILKSMHGVFITGIFLELLKGPLYVCLNCLMVKEDRETIEHVKDNMTKKM